MPSNMSNPIKTVSGGGGGDLTNAPVALTAKADGNDPGKPTTNASCSPEGLANDVPEWKVENDYSHYHPLDFSRKEIRLVTIASGAFDNPLDCKLTRHPAPWQDIDFEALSYCWGNLQDTASINLRHDYVGHEEAVVPSLDAQNLGDGPFNVTKSLDLALRYLRYEDRARTIWIDALCINQGSIRERNYAIPFMVDVYKAASCVVIFLGEENKKHNLQRQWQLMAMLKNAIVGGMSARGIQDPLTHRSDIQGMVDCISIEPKDKKPSSTDMFKMHMSLAFGDFFQYPYFQRVWVVQEVMNAEKAVVYCGAQKRDWVDVLIFMCMAVKQSRSYAGAWSGSLNLRDRLPPFLWTRLLAEQKTVNEVDSGAPISLLPLLDVLSHGRAFAATDPRDKVFALLSFGKETHDMEKLPPRLKPDYAKSSSEVWRDVTRQWIIDNESLAILGLLREEIDKNNQVAEKTVFISTKDSPLLSNAQSRFSIERPQGAHPSWALWHAEHPESAQRALFRLENNLSECSIPMDLDLLDRPENTATLELRGMVLDRIKSVQWPFKRWTFSESDIRQFNYSHTPPTSLEAGVSVAWGSLIGLIDGVGHENSEQVTVKAKQEIQIPTYPSGRSLLQSFIETLVCQRFTEAFFRATDDNESFSDLLRTLGSLNLEESTQTRDEQKDVANPQKTGLETMAHFAAHWIDSSRNDPDMKWIPESSARKLKELAKYGNSKRFTEMCQYAEGRCLFQLGKGAIGLCPQGSRIGDVVVSLSGGRTPFVLRQNSDNYSSENDEIKRTIVDPTSEHGRKRNQQWSLIGECYVHDLDVKRTTKEAYHEGRDSVQTFHIV